MGKPINALKHMSDCGHDKVSESSIPSLYLRLIWCLLIPIIYIVNVALFYFLFIKIRLIGHHKIYIYNFSIFVLVFMQPNIVAIFLGSIGKKIINLYPIINSLQTDSGCKLY